jgi:hypothetical protein
LANDVALGLRQGYMHWGYLNLKVKLSSFFLDLNLKVKISSFFLDLNLKVKNIFIFPRP